MRRGSVSTHYEKGGHGAFAPGLRRRGYYGEARSDGGSWAQ